MEIVSIENLVPQEHLLRKVDKAVEFGKLYEIAEPLYSGDDGRPSTDPVVLFKIVLLQHLDGLALLRGALRQAAVFIDGTHIRANANINRKIKQEVPTAAKRYRDKLMAEVNADREAHGDKPFDDDDPPKGTKRRDNTSRKKLAWWKKEEKGKKMVTVSTTDPDSGVLIVCPGYQPLE